MAGSIVCNTLNTDTGIFQNNNAYQGIAKAWVQFVGSTGAINGSFNVSSVTRNATGYYTVNFITAMPNINYCPIANTGFNTSSGYLGGIISMFTKNTSAYTVAPTTSSFSFCTVYATHSFSYLIDYDYVNVAVFGS